MTEYNEDLVQKLVETTDPLKVAESLIELDRSNVLFMET